ncbi:hypothetical protein CAEBREN_22088 [Caenorhabditis brenneri]|uniref:Receptor L-domain domain-containing protein n=1 Tax=Caenorhabditis brenneri TaxID=135651 RepID=G0MPZ5_CAEBE|nr:hypothetical protein CAEBREN_22088 [Caenorhabditis brenneri]
MMKNILLIFVFLLVWTSNIKCDEDVTSCVGEDVNDLPDTCLSIDTRPLRIIGDVEDSVLQSKLKMITKITSGVEVTETEIETFDFLPNVIILTSNEGPALKFHRNKKLARMQFPKLEQLKGKEEAILFDHDQFPTLATQNKKGLADLVRLREVAKKTAGSEGKVTCNNFLKVIKNEPPQGSNDTVLWVLCAIFSCIILACLLSYAYEKWCKAKKDKDVEKKKDTQKKSTKLPVQENPKNK